MYTDAEAVSAASSSFPSVFEGLFSPDSVFPGTNWFLHVGGESFGLTLL